MTIIAFISQKGGVGKSTLAQALTVETKKQVAEEIETKILLKLIAENQLKICLC